MKRRIGIYKNKVLVENAGTNLRKYEIDIKEVNSGNNNTGGEESSGWHYYKIINNGDSPVDMILNMAAILPVEIILSGGKVISTFTVEGTSSSDYLHPIAYLSRGLTSAINILGIKVHNDKNSLLIYNLGTNKERIAEIPEGGLVEKIISGTEALMGQPFPEDEKELFVGMLSSGVKEISKEEYYNLK